MDTGAKEVLPLPPPPLLLPSLPLAPFFEEAWQKLQLLHWHRPQWALALFSLQKPEQLSNFRSPDRPEEHTAGGGGGLFMRGALATQNGQALHWQRGQCAPRLFSEQNLAQLSTLRSPGKPDVHGAPLVAAAGEAAGSSSHKGNSRAMSSPLGARPGSQRWGSACRVEHAFGSRITTASPRITSPYVTHLLADLRTVGL